MGGSHAHRSADEVEEVVVRKGPRTVLLAFLAVFAVVTLVGVVLLWPDGDKVDALSQEISFAGEDVTFPRAEVLSVEEPCATLEEAGDDCGRIVVRVSEGIAVESELTIGGVPPDVLRAGLSAGDDVKLLRTPERAGQQPTFSYFGTVRTTPVALLFVVFVVVVIAVARLRGVLALVGLAFAAAVFVSFMLPALLSGENGVLVGMVGSSAIMYVVLYTTHGWSLRTSAALAGTLVGIVLTAAIGAWSVGDSRLTGVVEDSDRILATLSDLSFSGLLTCAIIIAGLGVLNDVTITQASAVWEIRGAAPTLSRRRVFVSGMRIGRDHIASSIYTIVFAYAGTALTILLLLSLYDRPFFDLLATEEIGQEVVRTLATSIGLVLAVPITTLIAVATLPPAVDDVAAQVAHP